MIQVFFQDLTVKSKYEIFFFLYFYCLFESEKDSELTVELGGIESRLARDWQIYTVNVVKVVYWLAYWLLTMETLVRFPAQDNFSKEFFLRTKIRFRALTGPTTA